MNEARIRHLLMELHDEIEPLRVTPKGKAFLELVRDGKSYAEAEQIVDLAYDINGQPVAGGGEA